MKSLLPKILLFCVPAGFLIIILFTTASCNKSEDDDSPSEVWDPTPYDLDIPMGFPDMVIPDDNPMTFEGVKLGRLLFYDPLLSADNTQSCASCHAQDFAFTDNNRRFSVGVDGVEGTRNAMSLANAGWMLSMNWDGSALALEEQAFEPVTNPVEMHESWSRVAVKLMDDDTYPDLFFDAFGTRNIDSSLVVKALAQFERTLISADSKWDRYLRGETELTVAEARGFEIFFTEQGDCFHCHTTILFTDNEFHNNGLDSVFTDEGLSGVTGDPDDLGRFKTPTLRNLSYTAPYMHDGRFESIDEVIDFYSEGLKFSATIDPLMKNVNQGGVRLSEEEKSNLKAFILTLDDQTFLNNPDYAKPR